MEIGPDGNLYILSHEWSTDPSLRNGEVRIYKISHETSTNITSQEWTVVDPDNLTSSLKTVKEGKAENWNRISTDFVPVNDNVAYSYNLSISAKDVNQLHSKVYYYNSSRSEIKSEFVFAGQDGTFDDNFFNVLKTPVDTKFIKSQIWVRPNPQIDSHYTLKNVRLEEIP